MSVSVEQRLAHLQQGHLNSIPTEVIVGELIRIIAGQQHHLELLQQRIKWLEDRQDNQAERIRAIDLGMSGTHGARV